MTRGRAFARGVSPSTPASARARFFEAAERPVSSRAFSSPRRFAPLRAAADQSNEQAGGREQERGRFGSVKRYKKQAARLQSMPRRKSNR